MLLQVWKDALSSKQQSPYMTHTVAGGIMRDTGFCPYQDVLAVGHTGGLSTMLVPGAGEPNFDSWVADPFQGKRARQEAEVVSLLDKLQPAMIVLDPSAIGKVAPRLLVYVCVVYGLVQHAAREVLHAALGVLRHSCQLFMLTLCLGWFGGCRSRGSRRTCSSSGKQRPRPRMLRDVQSSGSRTRPRSP